MSGFELTLFSRGGPVMVVLVVLALVGLTLFIERTLYLHRGQIPSSKAFLQGIKNALAKRRLVEAIEADIGDDAAGGCEPRIDHTQQLAP